MSTRSVSRFSERKIVVLPDDSGDTEMKDLAAEDKFSVANQFTFTPNATGPAPTSNNGTANSLPSSLLDIKP